MSESNTGLRRSKRIQQNLSADKDITCEEISMNNSDVLNLASDSPNFMNTLLQLVNKVTDIVTTNADLKTKIRELEESNKMLLQRVETLETESGKWTAVEQKHMSAPAPDVIALSSKVADELEARREKVDNLVVQGLPETPSDDEDEQKASITELLQSIEVNNPSVTRAFRMGRRSADRPRPIKVICGNSVTKQSALSKAKKLKDLPVTHKFSRVFIRHDLTQLQREQDYIRRQERKRQQNGQTNTNARQRPNGRQDGRLPTNNNNSNNSVPGATNAVSLE